MKNKTLYLAEFQLLAVAIVWGGGFVATEYCIEAMMPTSLILSIRFTLAAIVMALFSIKSLKLLSKKTLLQGIFAGALLFVAFYVQIIGQRATTVSNAAFLTATNVIMVPFVVWILFKHRPTIKFFILPLFTFVGVLILTINPNQDFSFNKGDLLVLFCAVLYAVHIAYLGVISKDIDAKILTLLQLGTCGIIACIVFFISDFSTTPTVAYIDGFLPAIYLALFSTCFCYFFQTKAQQVVPPGKVSIILCTEGLFGTIFSVVLGLEPFKITILVGGLIIISSVMLSEVDFNFSKKKK